MRDGAGDAIDTFSAYVPTSLPHRIVELLRRLHRRRPEEGGGGSTVGTGPEAAAAGSGCGGGGGGGAAVARSNDPSLEAGDDGGGVIEILDTDDDDSRLNFDDDGRIEDGIDDVGRRPLGDDPPPIPSHTSPAVESALLSSASAPPPPDASADVVLSLVESGKLSPLQAEGATLAISKFHRVYRGAAGNGTTRAGECVCVCERERRWDDRGEGGQGERAVGVSCGNVETSCLSRAKSIFARRPTPSRGYLIPSRIISSHRSLSLSSAPSVSFSLSPRFPPHPRFFSQVSSSATAPG